MAVMTALWHHEASDREQLVAGVLATTFGFCTAQCTPRCWASGWRARGSASRLCQRRRRRARRAAAGRSAAAARALPAGRGDRRGEDRNGRGYRDRRGRGGAVRLPHRRRAPARALAARHHRGGGDQRALGLLIVLRRFWSTSQVSPAGHPDARDVDAPAASPAGACCGGVGHQRCGAGRRTLRQSAPGGAIGSAGSATRSGTSDWQGSASRCARQRRAKMVLGEARALGRARPSRGASARSTPLSCRTLPCTLSSAAGAWSGGGGAERRHPGDR